MFSRDPLAERKKRHDKIGTRLHSMFGDVAKIITDYIFLGIDDLIRQFFELNLRLEARVDRVTIHIDSSGCQPQFLNCEVLSPKNTAMWTSTFDEFRNTILSTHHTSQLFYRGFSKGAKHAIIRQLLKYDDHP